MSSSDIDNSKPQVPSNSAPITEAPTSIPTMSGMSSFDPLVTTIWPPSGTSSMQRTTATSGQDSGSTKQSANGKGSTSAGNNNGKRSRQHPTNDMSTTVDPSHLDTRFEPWPEMAPNKKRKHPAGAQKTEESYHTTMDMGPNASEQTRWLNDNTITIPDDEPDSEADHDDLPSGNVSRACSPAPPLQSNSDHRARNRTAATKCRAKAKAAATELETMERETESKHRKLSAQASSLQNEVLELKNEVLMHGNCDSDVIQQYLSNAARRVIGGGMT
ncbi:hypothetical protein VMCG_04142 [Cytospora schulzeri]|uniref:BZIP domain-containing protein n=1 Tax=Cytospora schulzeri TaxID=448051 RepID=A0A423WTS6_9PEZI|nr:hypothetical protein VMCG_04142 [Valsa malicola]